LAKNDLVPEKCFGMLSVIKILLDSGKDFLKLVFFVLQEGELPLYLGRVFTTSLAADDAVRLGEVLGVGVVRCVSIRGLALLDGAYDLV